MAHRIYLYNIDNETGESYPHYLGEWNYELPPLFVPLFTANLQAKGTQLYANKIQGISNLRRFFDLLGQAYQLTYKKAFYEPVNQMFKFLDDLPYDTFQIDGGDVFNMKEQKHTQQAKDWVMEIKAQGKLYEKAMRNQNLNPLKDILANYGYQSFLEVLQTDWINCGLGYWNEDAYKYGYAEVFVENDLEGLRDAKNNIIAPAIYQEIYAFKDDVALVKKDDKFGYITTKGIEIVPPIYQEAYDVFDLYNLESEDDFSAVKAAIVLLNGKYGLVEVKQNRELIPVEYDNLEWITGNMFNAKLDEAYFLLSAKNEKLGDATSLTPFGFEYPDLYFSETNNAKKHNYYTSKGIYLGEYVEDSLEAISNQYYYAKPNKWQKKIVIIDFKGNMIESDIDQIITFSNYQTFAYRKSSEWFLFDTVQHRKIGDGIIIYKIPLNIDYLSNYLEDVYVLVTPDGTGLFDAKQAEWLIPADLSYTKIEHLDDHFLRVKGKKNMKFWNAERKELSESYSYVSEPINRETHQLLLYQNEELFALDQTHQIRLVAPEEMGYQYNNRHNLRGNDLHTFTRFYEAWKLKQGAAYYHYFDDHSLYEISLEFIREGHSSEAITVLELGAERLHPQMMTELGIIYSNDKNDDYYNIDRAIELYQKAAKLGEKNAWNNLGYHLQNGIGLEQNTQKAIDAYTKAGELQNGLGWSNLGDLYYYGELVEEDYYLALEYYLKAQKLYSFNDEKLASIYYALGEYKKLMPILKKDYEEEFSPIYYALIYEDGLGGTKVNLKKAVANYEKAIKIAHYEHAVKQLLFHYRKDSELHNEEKLNEWLHYAEEHNIEIDRELLGLPKLKKQSLINKLFKKK